MTAFKKSLLLREHIIMGQPVVLSAMSEFDPEKGVIFEDDGETGYLYVVESKRNDLAILDALHIYNSSGRQVELELDILEVAELGKMAVALQGTVQAVVDFLRVEACCRSGFPRSSTWTSSSMGHQWTEMALLGFEPPVEGKTI